MDDEAAFIETIRLHPDDDTPRLIYADWLEDRGDPRAAYLRLSLRIAELEIEQKNAAEFDEELVRLSMTLEPEWREAIGRRYDVVMVSYRQQYRMHMIKAVKEQTGVVLQVAIELVRDVPSLIKSGLLREEAHLARNMLERGHWELQAYRASVRPELMCIAELRFSKSK